MFNINTIENISLIEKILNDIGLNKGTSTYEISSVIISIAAILFIGFLLTRLTKLVKLPNVTAYICAGILIGKFGFNIIPTSFISGSAFLSDIALAFISFSAGEFFKIKSLKEGGAKVLVITLFETLITFTIMFTVLSFIIKLDILFSLVLASLCATTAPASTLMVIKQTKARGEYVNNLLQIIAFDNIISIILYSLSISLCIGIKNGGDSLTFYAVIKPILKTILCLGIGIGFGFLLKLLLPLKRTTDNRLIIVIAVLFLFCGICAMLDESPLLGCMGIGAVYTNLMDKDDKLFGQVNYFIPPIMLMFFVRSGMSFDLNAFTKGGTIAGVSLILIACVYFVLRIGSKFLGAFLGSTVTKSSPVIKKYIGFGLIPQAGVAIGLSQIGARIFESSGQNELGNALSTIILATSILYEFIGPVLAKSGLYLSGSCSKEIDTIVPIDEPKSVDTLIKQINEIKNTLPEVINENEEAYNEALEIDTYQNYHSKFMNRRK